MASERIFNFSAGPAVMPLEVLQRAQGALLDFDGTGIGIAEHSHRGGPFERVMKQVEADCRALAGIPDDYAVLFLQGGASTQFFQIPANLLPSDGTADYLLTGAWSEKALKEAKLYGKTHVAATCAEGNYRRIPRADEIRYSAAPVYAHFTSNNTIFGTQWSSEPPAPPGGAYLVCDASSDIFSRPLDVKRYGVIYAGAQKNLGPAGVTLVVMRRDLVERRARELPTMLRYDTHAKEGSLYNTPPTLSIYLMGLVLEWIRKQGGLGAMEQQNRRKAEVVYAALEAAGGFYECHAGEGSRSLMNITFRTPTPELDAAFVKASEQAGMSGLKGHRSVGGMRASVYNAFPLSGCEALASLLRDFAKRNG
ncbi:MAG TPA: 3-phosphoserine/phosphohydroxythreonine transaminase [Myxococcota bacterium]